MVRKMRKGFTLVELLIVIVIIGILAAALLLSSGSATDSAEASNIISDLRGLKSACLMLFVDSMDVVNTDTYTLQLTHLQRYMDNPTRITTGYGFRVSTDTANARWWVGFDMTNKAQGIRNKLAGRATSIGIYNGTDLTGLVYQGGAGTAWMVGR